MKPLLILILLLGMKPVLNGQVKFLDYHFNWTEAFSCFGSPGIDSYRYTIDSLSTEINGTHYYQLLESPTVSGDNFTSTGKYIRADDSSHVYLYEYGAESILYDFGLNIGDTFDIERNVNNCKIIVAEIDSVTLDNGEERKRWIFYISGEEYDPQYAYIFWIEGIGNTWGILGNSQICQIDGCGSFLLCLNYRNTMIYHNSVYGGDTCWLVVSSTTNPNLESIKIFPNPVLNTLTLLDPDQLVENVSIITADGKKAIARFEPEINVSDLVPGFFILKLELKSGERIFRKVLKF